MKLHHWLFVGTFILAGCTPDTASTVSVAPGKPAEPGDMLRENRAKLSAEDQKLVAEQEYCPIMPEVRLGAMGMPIKLIVKDQPLFLCCKACRKRAEADLDATLASLAEVKRKAKAERSSNAKRATSKPSRRKRASRSVGA